MELCEETLKDWLLRKRTVADRDPGLCSKILHGIVDGLVYLHESNMIHRDLKVSQNVSYDCNNSSYGTVLKAVQCHWLTKLNAIVIIVFERPR